MRDKLYCINPNTKEYEEVDSIYGIDIEEVLDLIRDYKISKDLNFDKFGRLEEIERLKEELKYTIPIVEHNQTIQSNINSYNKLAKYSEELEDRIDKAIEYIEDNYMTYKEASAYRDGIDNDYKIQISSIADLIDILKGTDKE